MNKQLLHMQKLAGLITENEYNKLVTEGTLKDKIKELVHSSLGEAKKKKKDEETDVAPQEDAPVEDTLEPTDMDMGMDTEAPSVDTGIDIDPKVKNIQDLLQKAYANAKSLGDEKLMTQIGNTITMVVRNQVLGGQVAESLNENNPHDDKVRYVADTLKHVWGMGTGKNSVDFEGIAELLIDDLESRFTESLNENDIFNGQYSISDETYKRMDNLVNLSDYSGFINSATNIMTTLVDEGFEVKDIFYYLYTRLTAEV